MSINSLRQIRESFLISKSELAKIANLSVVTLTRIEHGEPCRIETKRKILLALGLKLSDRDKVFH
jgi:DNA-binding XRE family transcriptional regulator